ncbi:methyl-accepting chemotaxis protein [Ferrovibrio sp.]|jgi:methyl-accepting chemotaxis protein|uniref:methyl-accepting chemotaxis protein n=1 Tax=Ferrovibrio sp. TaxID=1917215 RepID=UPI0035ADBFF3
MAVSLPPVGTVSADPANDMPQADDPTQDVAQDSARGPAQKSARATTALAALLARLGIRLRIAIGFAVALSLLAVVAAASIFGVQRGGDAFLVYDRITTNNQRLQEFERDVIDLRRSLLLFVERDDPRGLLTTRRLEPKMTETLASLLESVRDPQRRAALAEITPLMQATFTKLSQALTARNKLKSVSSGQLEVYGPMTRDHLMQLIRSAIRQNKFVVATEAGLVLDAFSEIRVAATGFVGMGDMSQAAEARGKVTQFVDMIQDLKNQLDNEEQLKLASDAERYAREYETGISDAVKAAGDLNRLVYQEMEQEIAQITAKLDEIKTSQSATLATEREAATAAFRATFVTVLVVSLAAFAVGLLFAWLIGRSIANPVTALTDAMTVLAKGDYGVDVPGLTRGDEIGRMAAAVAVFKQNGQENQRLRDAVEAERQAAERNRAEQDALLDRAVGEIVAAAANGDLAQRIDTVPLSGVAVRLGDGVNRLLDAIGGAIDAVGGVLSGLAAGDLTRRVEGEYRGVFAKLQGDVNMAGNTLADAMKHIADNANAVRDASAEISTGSQDLAQRTESQAAALEQTAASMHQVTATVKQNADNAQAANQLATAARDTASSGGTIVQQAVAAMGEIETSAQKIVDIVSLIDEIAFQTNLLALNASVEAARAGEAGKGFAVVAQEVRALAQRSANASKDIKALIQESNAQVKTGATLVNQAGSSLTEIVTAIKKVSDIVAEIAAASAEQARGLEEVNGAVVNMDEMTQRNGALVEQTNASAQTLANQSDALAGLLARFRIA